MFGTVYLSRDITLPVCSALSTQPQSAIVHFFYSLKSHIRSAASNIDAWNYFCVGLWTNYRNGALGGSLILPFVCKPSRFSRRNGQALTTGPLAPLFRMLVVVHPQSSRVTRLGFISNGCVSFVTLSGATQAPFYFDGSPFIVVFVHHVALTAA